MCESSGSIPSRTGRACALFLCLTLSGGLAPARAADCNGNGVEDSLEIANATREDCNENGIPDECEVIPIAFKVAEVRTAGDGALGVPPTVRVLRHADLDRDGRPDLITGSRTGRVSKLAVSLARGGGVFAGAVEYEAGEQLYDLRVADLDGDGDRDVISANGERVLLVFVNRGGGVLDLPARYALPEESRIVATGDLTGDGFPELVAGNRASGGVFIFRNRGDGTFEAASSVAGGERIDDLAIHDHDGDGDLDLATLGRDSATLLVYPNTGPGELGVPVSLEVPGSRPTILRGADFDGDGDIDYVVVVSTATFLYRNDGRGGFAAAETFSGGGTRAEVGDFDLDGDADIALTRAPAGLVVRYNDGEASFGVARPFDIGFVPLAMAPGDHDEDGDLDLIMTRSGSDTVLVASNGDRGGLTLRAETVPLTGCQDARGCRPHGGTSGDFDGDGYPDVLACITHPGTFAIAINDGTGALSARPYVFGGEHPQAADSGDLDGDGDRDAVTVDNLDNNLYVHLNQGDARFAPARRFTVGSAPIHVRLADLDGDEFLDAVVANESSNSISVLFNDGQGAFAPGGRRDHAVRAAPKGVDAADFDGDGLVDIIASNSTGREVSLFFNVGDRNFGPRVGLTLPASPHFVAAGDLDLDGDPDVISANNTARSVSIFSNRGDGTFDEPVTLSVGMAPYSVIVLDLDGDGAPDLVTANETTNNTSVLLGNGDGSFQSPQHAPAGTGPRFVLPGDLDRDGDLDFALPNREGQSLTVFYQQSDSEDPAFSTRICTPDEFHRMSAATPGRRGERFVKYLLPAVPEARLPPTLQNTRRFLLHQDFLAGAFADLFPALTSEEYRRLVGERATREFFIGAISRSLTSRGVVHGFTVFADFSDPEEALTLEEMRKIHGDLQEIFRLEPLVYAPTSRSAVAVAETWEDPGFEILLERSLPPFEAYTRGVGVGRVRVFRDAQFIVANQNGRISFQDIVVLQDAPRDIEGVTAGVITAEPQGELSHVAIRTARRGTPNAFVRDALRVFEEFDGELVRLTVRSGDFEVERVSQEIADRFWLENAPNISVFPSVDRDFEGFPLLTEIAAMDAEPGVLIESRFGGKVSNLARLQKLLEAPDLAAYRLPGFGIPVRHYVEFMETNQIAAPRDAARLVTYREFLEELFEDESFRGDSEFRFAALEELRRHIREDSVVDEVLVDRLAARIVEVFDTSIERVRFRSSSNVEDAIEFNGAGLYTSLSVCAEDDLDDDDAGPSHCDELRDDERGIARGLRRVWASLWNFRAYEERAFYGIDQRDVAMGVQVNKAFVGELANGVAFTGNPTSAFDRRYVVTVQPGEESVVSPEPGKLPEKDVLEVSGDGRVVGVIRAVSSSLVPEGIFVLSDAQLEELGALMWRIDREFPIDPGEHERSEILLDLEFKIDADGQLAVKQVRPFLLADPGPRPPVFELEVPEGITVCGAFRPDRPLELEYELKGQLRLRAGTLSLPTFDEVFSGELVEALLVGPDAERAEPVAPGVFRVRRFTGGLGEQIYSFDFEQDFELPDGTRLGVTLPGLDFRTEGENVVERRRVIDDAMFMDELLVAARFADREPDNDLSFRPCGYESLPLFEVLFILESGDWVRLDERFLEDPEDTGPARVTGAEVSLGGVRQSIGDYYGLVYAASRHNERVRYRVVLDIAVEIAGLEPRVHALDLTAPEPREGVEAAVALLDENMDRIGTAGVKLFSRRAGGDPEARFIRGDVDGDGAVTPPDALRIVRYLFVRGARPGCSKAADADDDGKLNIVDAVDILLHIFKGPRPLAAPFPACGVDETPDALGCVSTCGG